MPAIGWSEAFLVAVFWVLPVCLVAVGTRRVSGRIQIGWLALTAVTGWLGMMLWGYLRSKRPIVAPPPFGPPR